MSMILLTVVAALTLYFYRLITAMLTSLWHMCSDLFPVTPHLHSE